MLRTAIKVGILLLFVHAMYRFVPVYINYQQFKDAVKETALFSSDRTPQEITERVMELATRYHVPLEREYLQVERVDNRTYISLMYTEQIEWLPTYKQPYKFEVQTEGWQARPSVR